MTSSASLYRVQIGMAKPFAHARAVRAESDNVVLVLAADGSQGLGEGVPRDYVTGETVEGVLAAIRGLAFAEIIERVSAGSFADGVAAIEALRLPELLQTGARPALAAASAVELALLDSIANRAGVSLASVGDALALPETMRRRAAKSAPIRASRAMDLKSTPDQLRDGFEPDHMKVKGTTDASTDVARAKLVRDMLGTSVSLSVDANMCWSLDDALGRAEALRPFDVEWFEEPMRQYAWDDYRRLREQSGIKIMLDESLCSFDDARRAIDSGACDMFNIRVSKNGGLIGALRIAELAHRHGIGVQLGIHPGQSGILGAAGARFLEIVDGVVTVEASGPFIATSGLPERLIREALVLDHETARCANLGPVGLGVTLDTDVLARHATETIALSTQHDPPP